MPLDAAISYSSNRRQTVSVAGCAPLAHNAFPPKSLDHHFSKVVRADEFVAFSAHLAASFTASVSTDMLIAGLNTATLGPHFVINTALLAPPIVARGTRHRHKYFVAILALVGIWLRAAPNPPVDRCMRRDSRRHSRGHDWAGKSTVGHPRPAGAVAARVPNVSPPPTAADEARFTIPVALCAVGSAALHARACCAEVEVTLPAALHDRLPLHRLITAIARHRHTCRRRHECFEPMFAGTVVGDPAPPPPVKGTFQENAG